MLEIFHTVPPSLLLSSHTVRSSPQKAPFTAMNYIGLLKQLLVSPVSYGFVCFRSKKSHKKSRRGNE